MSVTIGLRRAARRTLGTLLVTVLLAAPAVVVAGHQFSDVPNDHPFHDDISAIGGAGITSGFTDGTYRPNDPVTRQAMAAFLRRTGGRAAWAGAPADVLTTTLEVAAGSTLTNLEPVRELTITVPGTANDSSPNQLVHLQGRVHLVTSMSTSAKGCPCEFMATIRDTTTGNATWEERQTFESISSNTFQYSFDVEGLLAAPPGPRTYRLEVMLRNRNSDANAASFYVHWLSSLSAQTFPFGP